MRVTAILLAWWVIVTLLWLLSATAWKGATLKRLPPGAPAWYWLRVFGIAESDQNRARLLNVIAFVGIVLVTVLVIVTVFFRP